MSTPPKTFGLPRMGKEKGERRVFLPDFVQQMMALGAHIYLEEGYGSSLGYNFAEYRQSSAMLHTCSRAEAFQKDVVLVLRAPERSEFDLLRRGSVLFSMLHYGTRPWRVNQLNELGVNAISMDSIVNDDGLRMVENMAAVAWNGLETAFDVLEKQLPGLRHADGHPLHILILGAGMVGKLAVEAATKFGSIERAETLPDVPVVAQVVGRSVTSHAALMRRLFEEADILVDATARRDSSHPVVPNDWIQSLPEHAVIADLAVDPYLLNDDPPVVRGIEGIPQGNLDQYVFKPQDPAWTATIPDCIPTTHRRTVVSCYSWPGIHPDACMHHYARQLRPLLEALLEKGYDGLSLQGSYFERALYRATLRHFLSESVET